MKTMKWAALSAMFLLACGGSNAASPPPASPTAAQVPSAPPSSNAKAIDANVVASLTGGKPEQSEGAVKVSFPRTDVPVEVDGWNNVPPFMGLTSWAAFTPGEKPGKEAMVMGDLVVFEDEVNSVMSALLDHGVEVTALHNHFFFESPRIFYMHVHGHGKAADLARMAKPALDLIGKGSPQHQSSVTGGGSSVAGGTIDTATLAKLIGHEGEQNGQVYKITIGRDDIGLKEMGATINARMGLNTWAAFFGTDANAEIAGDVAMLAHEVTPVLKALRANGLNVVAIHNHMTSGAPAVYFLHYWGTGPAEKLADGFKAALNELGKTGAAHTGH